MKRFLVCSLLILASACGYKFQGGGTILPPDVRKIAIPVFENDSAEAGLSNLFTDAFRDEFERYGVITIVDEENEADAILNGKIKKVKREVRTVTSGTTSGLQFDAIIELSAELKKANGAVLWKNDSLTISQGYGSTVGSVVTSSPFFASQNLAASDLTGLSSGEVARGQESGAFESLATSAARTVYDGAVAADF